MTKASNSQAAELMRLVNDAMKTDVLTLASEDKYRVKYLPTGLLPVDILLHGGLPRGRMVEINGDFSTLKSYIGLNAIRETQEAGGVCAVVDTEHSFDADWAEQVGVDIDNLAIVRPETGELAMDAAEAMIRGGLDLLVFDSVAATLPQTEHGKRLHKENVQPGRLAALMSLSLRKLTSANDDTAILWINQLRNNIGVTFGSPDITTGGRALPYYVSFKVNVRKAGKIVRPVKYDDGEKQVDGREQVAQKFRMTVEKSKLSRPFREVNFVWDLHTGTIDEAGFLMSQGLEHGLITQKGSSWDYNGAKAMGRAKFRDKLLGDDELYESLKKEVLDSSSPGVLEAASPKDTGRNGKSSANGEHDSTPDQAQGGSGSTARRKKRSSKSRTLRRPTR